MKYILILPILLLLQSESPADSLFVTPSVYYTRGEYTNNSRSDSYAGYLSLGTLNHRLLFSFDKLRIKNPGWLYEQQYFNAGAILGFGGLYVKLNYGNVNGTENSYEYRNDLFNFDLFYTDYYTYFGASYTLQKQGGIIERDINQFMLRLEHIPHWRVLFSVKPVYTNVSDGRNLFGAQLRINYLPFDYFLVRMHGFIGERAYFYDTDLMVLYNQDETQKYLAALQIEYYLSLNFNIAAGFQHTSFGSYKINYYILGIRTNFIVE